MSHKKDLTGQTFGYLKAIKPDKSQKFKRSHWICKCKCGKITSVTTNALTSSKTQSCGCKVYESKNYTHKMAKTRIYNIWCSIRKRCYKATEPNYMYYGSKGIKVCDEWNNSFIPFYKWSMDNGYTDELTIDRIDVNGNYEPSNCRWISHDEQQRNRSNNIFVEYNGEMKTISEISRIFNISPKLLYNRYHSAIKHIGKCEIDNLIHSCRYKPIYTDSYYKRNHYNRKVAQYTKNGDLVKVWDSIKSAENNGFNYNAIISCCKFRTKTSGGFVWRYVE